MLKPFSEKVFLRLPMPTDEESTSDQQRIQNALAALGYGRTVMPLSVLQQLYPLCRSCGYEITVTLVFRQEDWVIAAVEAGDQRQSHYGLAVDYGSTTVVMELVDLNTGSVIARAGEMNGQIAYGTDILTRITYTLEDSAHAEDIQRVTVETFHTLFDTLTWESGIDVRRCPVLILSGNTTMIHFLLKLNAWTVFASPYAPVTAAPLWLWGREVGMDFSGMLYVIPAASNYVGGDIVSGLLTLDLHSHEQPALFFDIGTNGELVIGCRDWMLGGAGAAGPALEGYISRFGMRAQPGAIDSVRIEGRSLSFTTVAGERPVGICGSGIIDLIAQMRRSGWINIAGELEPRASERIVRLTDGDEQQYAAVYATAEESATGEPLVFTQQDIRQYLDTKAAAYTMIECLLETAGCRAEELRRCYLSGAFTAHSDLEAAITVGIFPDLPRERYAAIANTSLDGAKEILLRRDKAELARTLAENMYCVQFASVPDFLVRMQAAKFIPHTDTERWPRVMEKLK